MLPNLYAEYIIRNAGLDETQAGIKIARRNVINLRYAGLPSMGSHIVRHDWSDLAAAAADMQTTPPLWPKAIKN